MIDDVLGLDVLVSSVVVGRMLCWPPENEIVTKKKTSQCQKNQKKMIKPKYQNKEGKVAESSVFVVVNIQPFMLLLCGPCDPLMGQGSQGSNRISKEQMWHN